MYCKKTGNYYVLRFEIGEEIVSTLKNFVKKENIHLGTVTGIGAADKIKLGLYNVKGQQYQSKEFTGEHEIASLSGNITSMDDEPYLHLHITISDKDFNAYAGHLDSAIVSATCEIFIHVFEGRIDRKKEEKTGLNVLNIGNGTI